MYRIIKIGMDVHSKNYTLCAMEPLIGEEDRIFANIQVTADYKNILMFIEQLKRNWECLMNMISNADTKQDVWDILCITSLQPQA